MHAHPITDASFGSEAVHRAFIGEIKHRQPAYDRLAVELTARGYEVQARPEQGGFRIRYEGFKRFAEARALLAERRVH